MKFVLALWTVSLFLGVAASALVPRPHYGGVLGTPSSLLRDIRRRRHNKQQQQQLTTRVSTYLCDIRGGDDNVSQSRRGVDWVALFKYSVGMGVQVSLVYGVLSGIDAIVAKVGMTKIPFWANAIFFYFFNANTGLFNPLSKNAKPKANNFRKPAWTPPGWVFAVMWPLFVFGIRAVTASMIVAASDGVYATTALLSLFVHLSFGNLWSTINRVEQRLGASVPALYGLLLSNLYTSFRFYRIRPLAGQLLAATSIWLAAAAALETHAWILNPDSDTDIPEPLYPAREAKWKSKFMWEL